MASCCGRWYFGFQHLWKFLEALLSLFFRSAAISESNFVQPSVADDGDLLAL